MEFVTVLLTAVFSSIALFGIARLIGYRQMSQMTVFDYINGITVGSIAAELSTATGGEFVKWLVSLAVFGGITFFVSRLTCRSIKARELITGKPVLLASDGKLYFENFKKARLDLEEFLMLLRNQGYFDLSKLGSVILEANGKLSILPLAEENFTTPKEMGIAVSKDELALNVIVDGHVMKKSLAAIGYDEAWLAKELARQRGEQDIRKIFLATLTLSGKLAVFTYGELPKLGEHLE